jgi:hypothetical protein
MAIQLPGRVVAEHKVVGVFGSCCFRGAREHCLLVFGQRGLKVVGVRGDDLAEFGFVSVTG